MEVMGLLSATGVPTQGNLPSSAGATAVEFAAVLDGLDLQPAEADEDVAEPAQDEEQAEESEEPEQPQVNVIPLAATVPAPAAAIPTALPDASRSPGDSPAPLDAGVDAAVAANPAAPQLAATENMSGDSGQTPIAPAAMDMPDSLAEHRSDDRLRLDPATQRASATIVAGVVPSQQAATPVVSAASRPQASGAMRDSQSQDPTTRLELADLANFTVTVHESRLSSLAPDSHATTRAQPAPDARHVLQQIGDKLTDGAEGVVEIALSPEELGKVRLVITGGDKPAVTVHADRPETYDLLRRNAEALDKELRSAGIFGADISFSGGNDRPGNRNPALLAASRSSGPRDHLVNFAEHTAPNRPRSVLDRRIDIRI